MRASASAAGENTSGGTQNNDTNNSQRTESGSLATTGAPFAGYMSGGLHF
jgi:hypothetical protein